MRIGRAAYVVLATAMCVVCLSRPHTDRTLFAERERERERLSTRTDNACPDAHRPSKSPCLLKPSYEPSLRDPNPAPLSFERAKMSVAATVSVAASSLSSDSLWAPMKPTEE